MRKTAAVCVAKLFDINPELVEDRGFLDLLKVCILGLQHVSLAGCMLSSTGLWAHAGSRTGVWLCVHCTVMSGSHVTQGNHY